MKEIKIGKRKIGLNNQTYFIADIGANHDGKLERAIELIFKCAETGADAAKFQNFQVDKIVSKYGFENMNRKFAHQAEWEESVYEVYQDASISIDWTPILKETCSKAGIDYFTSTYDFESVDGVDPYVDIYKIGSGDITWLEIIEYIAKKGKPIIISTGASTLKDVKRAMAVLQKINNNIVLMQCNTNYTGSYRNFKYINLNVFKTYRKLFPNAIFGLSDHTFGHATVLGAIALGACVIEKHFTDDNSREGPDHKFAMNPTTWKEMVEKARELKMALGNGEKIIEGNEQDSLIIQRRALRAKEDIDVGSILKRDNIIPLRPCPKDAIPPYRIHEIIGKTVKVKIKKGDYIKWEYLRDD
jgi:N-acetylneuraminate synthase